jgi:hypothetical protein
MLKKILAAALLLTAAGTAAAQTIPPGITVDKLRAKRDAPDSATLITGALRNQTGHTLKSASIVFTLQDAQGNEVGTASDITYNLANNTVWQIRATVMQPFTRFTAYEVKIE